MGELRGRSDRARSSGRPDTSDRTVAAERIVDGVTLMSILGVGLRRPRVCRRRYLSNLVAHGVSVAPGFASGMLAFFLQCVRGAGPVSLSGARSPSARRVHAGRLGIEAARALHHQPS